VADPTTDDPETAWYVNEFGGDVGILEPKFGSVFVSEPDTAEDLIFVSRADETLHQESGKGQETEN
jgi:hypothetical protein